MVARTCARRVIATAMTFLITLSFPTPLALSQEAPQGSREDAEIECITLEGATDRTILAQAAVGDEYRNAHKLATGSGVRVAVIDTGVARHPRLGPVEDGGNLVEDSFDGYFDCDAHGTIVASVIAARDTGDGIVGVAPDSTVISIRQSSSLHRRAGDQSSGSLQTLIDAIHVALDKKADVINVSVVSCIPPTAAAVDTSGLDAALARAERQGTVVVSAAGNESSQCPQGSTVYPAHHDQVVGVAAYEDPATIADYSISSPWTRLSAPGLVPTALSPDSRGLASGTTQNGSVSNFSGTSFAAPYVAGTVALMKQRAPRASAADIRRVLYESVDPLTGAVSPEVAVSMMADETPPTHAVVISAQDRHQPPTLRNTVALLSAIAVFFLLLTIALGRKRKRN